MSNIINAYTIDPMVIKQGDVAVYVIKVMVGHDMTYRLYRCPYDPDGGDEVPQGDRVFTNVRETCEALFPSVAAVATAD